MTIFTEQTEKGLVNKIAADCVRERSPLEDRKGLFSCGKDKFLGFIWIDQWFSHILLGN